MLFTRYRPRLEDLENRNLLAVATLTASLTGAQEVPPTSSTATGTATVTVDTTTGKLSVSATVTGITLANANDAASGKFDLQEAPFGQSGPVVLNLAPTNGAWVAGPGTTIRYTATNLTFPPSDVQPLLAGNFYLNLKDPAFPGGEIRGQIFEPHILVAGAGADSLPQVIVYDVATRAVKASFLAYDSNFRGGVRVTAADVNGDGVEDVIVVAGPGGPAHVKVIDGNKLNLVDVSGEIAPSALLASFYAFDAGFLNGAYIATGDFHGDGYLDLVVGADAGAAAHVKVIDGTKLAQVDAGGQIAPSALLGSFYAFDPGFHGGVRVAAADVNGDGKADVVAGAGPGAAPHVKVIDGTRLGLVQANGAISDAALLRSFYAYDAGFQGGVYVAAGFVNNDKFADIVTGAGPGAGPHVKVVNGQDTTLLQSFYAFQPNVDGGVSVAALDIDNNDQADLVAATATGTSAVAAFDGVTLAPLAQFFAFDLANGAFVGGR
jgi:hypothetical protein